MKLCVLLLIAGNSLFFAFEVKTINGTNDITFPWLNYNEGNDYDPNTGVYTCRIPGTYWFSASLGKRAGVNDFIACYILVNGSPKMGLVFVLVNGNNNSRFTVSGSGGFHLAKGDRVQVGGCTDPENIANYYNTHFSGVLIRPDA